MGRVNRLLLLVPLCSAGALIGYPIQHAADSVSAEAVDIRHPRPAGRPPPRRTAVPATLREPADRADYLAVHYWDHFDFADTVLIGRPEISEQAFVDFLSVLPYTRNAAAAVDTLYTRASAENTALYYFIKLGDKYLYEPNSPMHDEELYILVLQSLIDNPRIAAIDKLRPRKLLELALKNRPGGPAADFEFLGRDGVKRRMSSLTAEYTLLYFYDPTCDECGRVKKRLASTPIVGDMLQSGRLDVLSVSVAGDDEVWRRLDVPKGWTDGRDPGERLVRNAVYDLKAMPTLYLLDPEKRVLLKDASAEQVEEYLVNK